MPTDAIEVRAGVPGDLGGNHSAHSAGSGRTAGAPLLVADWERALFMHFEVAAGRLQLQVPFTLDLWEGRAWVSLVAFTMRGMRWARGGRLSRWLFAPFAEQRFLNLRTYVRTPQGTGIYFIAEWVSHGLCVPFGPLTYGLPYRWGHLSYRHDHEAGGLEGRVSNRSRARALEYRARVEGGEFKPCPRGGRGQFLLERYAAFTRVRARRLWFEIDHDPWPQMSVEVVMQRNDLIEEFDFWLGKICPVEAHYSPGVFGVRMGRPRRCL